MPEPERRTWETVLLSSIGNGAIVGTATGAVAGAATGTVILLIGALSQPSKLFGALLVGDAYGGIFGALAGSIAGLLAGVTGGLLLVAAGGSRLKRSTARAIGAVSPGLAGLLIGSWSGSLKADAGLVLVLTAIGAPLGIWRAPRVAYGSPSPSQLPLRPAALRGGGDADATAVRRI
jgi:hypothetical protein